MCKDKNCECKVVGKPIQYQCDCDEECTCGIVEFDEDPKAIPYCCGVPMKKIK